MEKIVVYLIVGYCLYYVVRLVYKSVTGGGKPCCSDCTDCSDGSVKKQS